MTRAALDRLRRRLAGTRMKKDGLIDFSGEKYRLVQFAKAEAAAVADIMN